MTRALLPALLIICSGSILAAQDSLTKQWQISTAEIDEDWAPGDGGSNGWGDLPACDYIGEAFIRDCEITPETPTDPPATAPDNCYYYDWTYDPEVYMYFGCG